MADYSEKEQKVVDNIVNTLGKLDDSLADVESLEGDTKSHKIKEWFEEHKAIHEIKHILHDAGKYDKYEGKEVVEDEKAFAEFIDKLTKD